MFGKNRYFGLTGTKLNIAIGALAGLDFLLFGYDQGVMGGLLDLPSFVRINPPIEGRKIEMNRALKCFAGESFPRDRHSSRL